MTVNILSLVLLVSSALCDVNATPSLRVKRKLAEESVTFGYTGDFQTFTVPGTAGAPVHLYVTAAGAAGGGGMVPAGMGAIIEVDFESTGGYELRVFVGGLGGYTVPFSVGGYNGGGYGWEGGGGGGSTDIREGEFVISERIFSAAGGGGSAADSSCGESPGGDGGHPAGGDGTNSGCALGGFGATTKDAGVGIPESRSGKLFYGGSSSALPGENGGGGGGGWYGGAKGNRAGGGGCSSYTNLNADSIYYSSDTNSADGYVIISYFVEAPTSGPTDAPTPFPTPMPVTTTSAPTAMPITAAECEFDVNADFCGANCFSGGESCGKVSRKGIRKDSSKHAFQCGVDAADLLRCFLVEEGKRDRGRSCDDNKECRKDEFCMTKEELGASSDGTTDGSSTSDNSTNTASENSTDIGTPKIRLGTHDSLMHPHGKRHGEGTCERLCKSDRHTSCFDTDGEVQLTEGFLATTTDALFGQDSSTTAYTMSGILMGMVVVGLMVVAAVIGRRMSSAVRFSALNSSESGCVDETVSSNNSTSLTGGAIADLQL
jgi:hypothetical protein